MRNVWVELLKHSYFGILSSYKWVDKCTYDNFDPLDIIQLCLINCCKMYTNQLEKLKAAKAA